MMRRLGLLPLLVAAAACELREIAIAEAEDVVVAGSCYRSVADQIAAGDRNYVNWLRGGRFNPSGMIRVPSVHGDGTGVFGSVASTRRLLITTFPAPDEHPC